jgi:hypothetical protein
MKNPEECSASKQDGGDLIGISPTKSPNKTGIFSPFSQRTVFMFIKEKFEDATI